MEEFIYGRIANPTRALDATWIAKHPRRAVPTEDALETHECLA